MNKAIIALMTTLLAACATANAQPGPDTSGSAPPAIDLATLIEKVSAETHKEFVYDTRFLRNVAASTTAARDADLDTLLAILRENDFVAVETADQVLIVPEATARTMPTRILQKDDRSVSDHEYVTRILDVPGKGPDGGPIAPALVPILRPMMSQSGLLGAPQGADKLIIVDRYDNVRRITDIVKEIEK